MNNLNKIMRNFLLLLFYSLIFSYLVVETSLASQITVIKDSVNEIEFGDILTVNIQIRNFEGRDIDAIVQEFVIGADPIDPSSLISSQPSGGLIAALPPFYRWNLTLPQKSERTITYKIKPLSFGEYNIGQTKVTTSGETFFSNSLSVMVKCKSNGICEPNLGENYLTCPEDCPFGSTDNICDLIKDGKCDPDCTPDADPDCITTTIIEKTTTTAKVSCNRNDKCEKRLGENYNTCPQDCSSGGKDEYCDGIEDSICDPDCTEKEDPDCEKPKTFLYIYIIVTIIFIAVILYFIMRIKRRNV